VHGALTRSLAHSQDHEDSRLDSLEVEFKEDLVPISRISLADEIRSLLRAQILSGDLASGQRLTEQGVAQEMGTSPGPVREAFASLSQEGLLITLPRRGTFVTNASEFESRIAYDVRTWVEPEVATLAMEHAGEDAYALMAEALQGMRDAAEASSLVDLIQHDIRFHSVFYDLVGSEVLKSIWTAVSIRIQHFAILAAPYYYAESELREVAEQHSTLLGLFRAHDAEALRPALSSHVGNLWRRVNEARAADEEQDSPAEASRTH
jgi:DNA-binding GntR family transcriptional regulator